MAQIRFSGLVSFQWSQFKESHQPTMAHLISCLLLMVVMTSVQCYPGALCNVTYEVPVSCPEVWSGLEKQMKEWDNTTRCPGDCDQRHFLQPQRGPPLVGVRLEGSGEECDKCPCGQKCLYVHTYTDPTFLKGSFTKLQVWS